MTSSKLFQKKRAFRLASQLSGGGERKKHGPKEREDTGLACLDTGQACLYRKKNKRKNTGRACLELRDSSILSRGNEQVLKQVCPEEMLRKAFKLLQVDTLILPKNDPIIV